MCPTISRNYALQTLTTLNLSNNRIADQGAQHLAGALTVNKVKRRMILHLSLYDPLLRYISDADEPAPCRQYDQCLMFKIDRRHS